MVDNIKLAKLASYLLHKLILCLNLNLILYGSLYAQLKDSSLLTECSQSVKIVKVIFYRPFKLNGCGHAFNIFYKDTLRTVLKVSSFYVMELPIGVNRVIGVTKTLPFIEKSKNSIDLNLKPGKVYFVKCQSKAVGKLEDKILFKLLKSVEVNKALKGRFIRNRLKNKLYNDFYNQL